MATMNNALKVILAKYHQLAKIRQQSLRLRAFSNTNSPSGPIQTGSPEEAAEAAVDAVSGESSTIIEMAEDSSCGISTATAQAAANKAEFAKNRVVETAQDLNEKAKQTVNEAWGSAKATARNVQETVLGKAEEGKQTIKETADTVKNAMNTKNVR